MILIIKIRFLEPIMGISQFDTLRAVIIWSWVHSYYLKYDTYLFDVESDPTERFNLATEYPQVVSALLQKANDIKVKRPIQYEYWMVVPQFQETLVRGNCDVGGDDIVSIENLHLINDETDHSNHPSSLKSKGGGGSDGGGEEEEEYCLFAHPWIPDEFDPATYQPLLHTKDVARRLIREMVRSSLKYFAVTFLVLVISFMVMRKRVGREIKKKGDRG
jgi:hypothetical protein